MILMVQPAFMYSSNNFDSYFCQLVSLLLPSNQHSTLLNQLPLQLLLMMIIILSTLKMTMLSGQRNVTCGFTFTQQIVFPRSNLLPRTLFLLTLYLFQIQFAFLTIPSLICPQRYLLLVNLLNDDSTFSFGRVFNCYNFFDLYNDVSYCFG